MAGFYDWPPVVQALCGGLFTWALTAAGALPVLFAKRVNRKMFDGMLGFAAGVMMAASYWSLLAPAIEMAGNMGSLPWLPAVVGFVAGAVVLRLVDFILPHLHPGLADHPEKAEGVSTSWRRSTLLILAITLHNFPEGLAVGVAFGATAYGIEGASIGAAIALTVGIGIQNFPEGLAVAMPLRREGLSRGRCLWYGQLSGVVEPVAAVIGAGLVILMRPILPYALAFAAGAMIFVVVEELIPEAQREGNEDIATMGVIAGFTVMMFLDVALG
ncbi:MAG: ZIP family metal transporter [Candidatus Brocadiae bacterium]|nr:ZIP family metal transporter [Candidatus Brocadiia bacterium]